jgi:hypothetical protein
MKGCLTNVGRGVVAIVVWLVVSFLPLVPATQAPVVPDPIYRPTLVSIQQFVGVDVFLLGVSYRATWATLPVIIGLTAAGLVGGWWLGRKVFGRRQRPAP